MSFIFVRDYDVLVTVFVCGSLKSVVLRRTQFDTKVTFFAIIVNFVERKFIALSIKLASSCCSCDVFVMLICYRHIIAFRDKGKAILYGAYSKGIMQQRSRCSGGIGQKYLSLWLLNQILLSGDKQMTKKQLILMMLVIAISLTSLMYVTFSQESTPEAAEATEDLLMAYAGDPSTLPACGAYLEMVTLEPALPLSAVPSSTPNANAATATPPPATSTPRPAPSQDNVGFPENYATDFKLFFIFNRADRKLLRMICGNEIAAQRQEGDDYAYGSVLLMISYSAKLDAEGQAVLDENGRYIGQNLVALHVMRKEEGFGEAYGADRNGEWEYMAYNADGSVQVQSINTNFCAACHGNDAGETVDYVFRMNLLYEGETALIAPARNENEVSIYLYAFHEGRLEVSVGTTVTWINHDEAAHSVVAAVVNGEGRIVAAEEPMFASDILGSVLTSGASSFSFTFTEAGEYLYRCSVHDNEIGRIIVTE
jgi:plastocyanin